MIRKDAINDIPAAWDNHRMVLGAVEKTETFQYFLDLLTSIKAFHAL